MDLPANKRIYILREDADENLISRMRELYKEQADIKLKAKGNPKAEGCQLAFYKGKGAIVQGWYLAQIVTDGSRINFGGTPYTYSGDAEKYVQERIKRALYAIGVKSGTKPDFKIKL